MRLTRLTLPGRPPVAEPKPKKPRAKPKAADAKSVEAKAAAKPAAATAGAGAGVPAGTMTARCRKCALDQPGAIAAAGGDLLSAAAAAPDRCAACGGPVAWWCATHSPAGPVWFDGPECPDCAAAIAAATTVVRKPAAGKAKAAKPAPAPVPESAVASAPPAKKRPAKAAASEPPSPKSPAAPAAAVPVPRPAVRVPARAPEIAGVATEGVVRRCTNCGTEYAATEPGAECHVCFEKLGWWCRRHSPAGGAWLSGASCPGCAADARRGPRAPTAPGGAYGSGPGGGPWAGAGARAAAGLAPRSVASGSRALGLAAMAAARRLAGGFPMSPRPAAGAALPAGAAPPVGGVTMVPAFGAAGPASGGVSVAPGRAWLAGGALWALSALHAGLAAAAVHGARGLDSQTKATILLGTAAAVVVALARAVTAPLLVIRAAALAGAVWFLWDRHHAAAAGVLAAASLYAYARRGRPVAQVAGVAAAFAAVAWFWLSPAVGGAGAGAASASSSGVAVPAAAAAVAAPPPSAAPPFPANPDIASLPTRVGPRRVLAGSGPAAATALLFRPPDGRLTAFGGDTSARTFVPGSAAPPDTTPNSPANAFRALAASADGALLADTRRGRPSSVGIYRLSSGAFSPRGRAECRGAVECLAAAEDGHALAAGRADGTLELFDGEGRATLVLTDPTGGALKAVAFAPGGERLAAAGPLGFACWNLSGLGTSPETQWRAPAARGVLAAAWLPGARTLATVHAGAGEKGFAVRFWDASGVADLPMREAAFAEGPAPVAAALRSDLRQVAVSLPGAPPAVAVHDLPRP